MRHKKATVPNLGTTEIKYNELKTSNLHKQSLVDILSTPEC